MTPEQFAYWAQGFFELSDVALTKREQIIKDHLKEVFHKKNPDRSDNGAIGGGGGATAYPLDQIIQRNYPRGGDFPNVVC